MSLHASGLIIIPAYQPQKNLIDLIDEIISKLQPKTEKLVVINDGSTTSEACEIFKILELKKHVKVLHHKVNQGKGAALKTGIELAKNMNADFIVTADADGQHLPKDIVKIYQLGEKDKLVIGARSFDVNVPLRSRIGNVLTRFLFKCFYKESISDTQSGLRLIPKNLYQEFVAVKANGYQFELETLINASRKKAIKEVPITTVYEPGNPTSHFNPFFDSLQIYYVLFRGVISSLFTTVIDIVIFASLIFAGASTFTAIAIARTISSILNFILGKKFIFRSQKGYLLEFIKYASLVILNASILTPAINFAAENYEMNKVVSYVLGATLLFLFNFFAQKYIVFK